MGQGSYPSPLRGMPSRFGDQPARWRCPQGHSAHRRAGASPRLLPPLQRSRSSSLGSGPTPSRRSFAAPTTPAGTGSQPRTPHTACHGSGSQSSVVATSSVRSLTGAPNTPAAAVSIYVVQAVAHSLREEDRRRRRLGSGVGRADRARSPRAASTTRAWVAEASELIGGRRTTWATPSPSTATR